MGDRPDAWMILGAINLALAGGPDDPDPEPDDALQAVQHALSLLGMQIVPDGECVIDGQRWRLHERWGFRPVLDPDTGEPSDEHMGVFVPVEGGQ